MGRILVSSSVTLPVSSFELGDKLGRPKGHVNLGDVNPILRTCKIIMKKKIVFEKNLKIRKEAKINSKFGAFLLHNMQ